jgi:uncharacterized membrane protein
MTAMAAAIVCAVTFAVRIPLPFASSGYLNIGDAPIYIASFMMGGPAGAMAGAIGSALADVLSGYAVYAAPTFVIKWLMGFICGKLTYRKSFKRFLSGSIIAGAVMVAGYAVFEGFFFNLNQALAAIPFNAVQWAGGVAAAAALYPAVNGLYGGDKNRDKNKDEV